MNAFTNAVFRDWMRENRNNYILIKDGFVGKTVIVIQALTQ